MTDAKDAQTAVETADDETETENTTVPPVPPQEEPTPMSTPSPTQTQPTLPAPPRDDTFERQAVRRGCFSIVFGAVLGALVGMALTLAVLSWLNNGLLTYNQADVRLRHQLDGEIATRQTILQAQATAVHDIATRQAAVETEMAQTLGTTEAEMAGLRVTAVYLETRIAGAGNAADTLDAFLLGLDDLLSDVSPSSTPTPTVSMTDTPIPSSTPLMTPTLTPTR